MLKKYNRYRVLKVFLDSPTQEFGLREISRFVGIAPVSVINYLKSFEEEGLIIKTEKKGRPIYKAERENENFILYKKMSIFYELHESGLIEYLWEKLAPEVIILYGSHAKGESIENSDIDIFIMGKEKKIDLNKFEKRLNNEIHLMFNKDIKHMPKELKNNLINGTILKGYFKVV